MKERIYELYVEKGYSTRDVAKELGIGQTTVRRKMKQYGIPARTGKEARNTPHILAKKNELSRKMEVREQRFCECCGKEFFIQPHIVKKNCSLECARISTSQKLVNRAEIECDYCQAKIERISSRLSINTHNFCDNTCHGKWKSEHLIGSNNPAYRRIDRICANCGERISIIPSRDKYENVYCDRECMAEHYSKSEMFSGQNSPVWKGGKTTRNEYGANWMSVRKKVRERENYSCLRCGKTEEENNQELSVHHIKNFKLYETYQEANNLENLVGLCRECHTFVHSNRNIEKQYISEDIV